MSLIKEKQAAQPQGVFALVPSNSLPQGPLAISTQQAATVPPGHQIATLIPATNIAQNNTGQSAAPIPVLIQQPLPAQPPQYYQYQG